MFRQVVVFFVFLWFSVTLDPHRFAQGQDIKMTRLYANNNMVVNQIAYDEKTDTAFIAVEHSGVRLVMIRAVSTAEPAALGGTMSIVNDLPLSMPTGCLVFHPTTPQDVPDNLLLVSAKSSACIAVFTIPLAGEGLQASSYYPISGDCKGMKSESTSGFGEKAKWGEVYMMALGKRKGGDTSNPYPYLYAVDYHFGVLKRGNFIYNTSTKQFRLDVEIIAGESGKKGYSLSGSALAELPLSDVAFSLPLGVAVTADGNTMYTSEQDTSLFRLRKISPLLDDNFPENTKCLRLQQFTWNMFQPFVHPIDDHLLLLPHGACCVTTYDPITQKIISNGGIAQAGTVDPRTVYYLPSGHVILGSRSSIDVGCCWGDPCPKLNCSDENHFIHRRLVQGSCQCVCRYQWYGQHCENCPTSYDRQADCARCNAKEGYFGLYPDCVKNISQLSSALALAVIGNNPQSSCRLSCSKNYTDRTSCEENIFCEWAFGCHDKCELLPEKLCPYSPLWVDPQPTTAAYCLWSERHRRCLNARISMASFPECKSDAGIASRYGRCIRDCTIFSSRYCSKMSLDCFWNFSVQECQLDPCRGLEAYDFKYRSSSNETEKEILCHSVSSSSKNQQECMYVASKCLRKCSEFHDAEFCGEQSENGAMAGSSHCIWYTNLRECTLNCSQYPTAYGSNGCPASEDPSNKCKLLGSACHGQDSCIWFSGTQKCVMRNTFNCADLQSEIACSFTATKGLCIWTNQNRCEKVDASLSCKALSVQYCLPSKCLLLPAKSLGALETCFPVCSTYHSINCNGESEGACQAPKSQYPDCRVNCTHFASKNECDSVRASVADDSSRDLRPCEWDEEKKECVLGCHTYSLTGMPANQLAAWCETAAPRCRVDGSTCMVNCAHRTSMETCELESRHSCVWMKGQCLQQCSSFSGERTTCQGNIHCEWNEATSICFEKCVEIESKMVCENRRHCIVNNTLPPVTERGKKNIEMIGFEDWSTQENAFTQPAFDGEWIWFPPCNAHQVAKIHKDTNVIVNYTIPGVELTDTVSFIQAVFDGQSIWLIPFNVHFIVKIDKDMNNMTVYNDTWPVGFNWQGNNKFGSGAYDNEQWIWMVPYQADRVMKVHKVDGKIEGFKTWPLGFRLAQKAFRGAVFDGDWIWMPPYEQDQVLKIHHETGEMRAYSGWPDDYVKGRDAFVGAVFDGEWIWMCPFSADRVIKVHKKTSVMVGYKQWPDGFTKHSNSFMGPSFDGQLIWLVPSREDMLISVGKDTGAMVGYDQWPPHFRDKNFPFFGSVFDGKSLWLSGNNYRIVKVSSTIFNQDGFGFSGTIQRNPLPETVEMTSFKNWPSGFSSSPKFIGAVFDGEYIWAIPNTGEPVLKIHKDTGEMTGISVWPENFVKGGGDLYGGAFDGKRIWLVPYNTNTVISISKDTGEMVGYTNWPNGFTKLAQAFIGGVFDGQWIWLIPASATSVVKIHKDSGIMEAVNQWPVGWVNEPHAFVGGVFDGQWVWMVPNTAPKVVKVHKDTGEMIGYGQWPSELQGINGKPSAASFHGGVFDGEWIWLIPHSGAVVVKVHANTGVMQKVDSWPAGKTKTGRSFVGGAFDGEWIWMVPYVGDSVFKIHKTKHTMIAYSNWPSVIDVKNQYKFYGGVFDGTSVWLVPELAGAFVRISPVALNKGPVVQCTMNCEAQHSAKLSCDGDQSRQCQWIAVIGKCAERCGRGRLISSQNSSSKSAAVDDSEQQCNVNSQQGSPLCLDSLFSVLPASGDDDGGGTNTEETVRTNTAEAEGRSSMTTTLDKKIDNASQTLNSDMVENITKTLMTRNDTSLSKEISISSQKQTEEKSKTLVVMDHNNLPLTKTASSWMDGVKEEEEAAQGGNDLRTSVMTEILPEATAQAANAVGSSSAGVSAAIGTPSISSSGAIKSAMIMAVIDCEYADDDEEPSLYEHPVQIRFGAENSKLSLFSGSMMMTSLLFCLLPALLVLLFWLVNGAVSSFPQKGNARKVLELVSMVFIVLKGYFDPAVLKVVTFLIGHGQATTDYIAAGIGAASTLIITAILSYIVLKNFSSHLEFTTVPKYSKSTSKRKGDSKNDPGDASATGMPPSSSSAVEIVKKQNCATFCWHGPKENFDVDNKIPNEVYNETFGVILEPCRAPQNPWSMNVFFFELIVADVVGILVGIRPSSRSCTIVSIAVTIVGAIHFGYMIFVRPYRTRLDTAFSIAISASFVAQGIVSSVLASDRNNRFFKKVIGVLLLMIDMMFFLQLIVSAFWCYAIRVRKAVRKREGALRSLTDEGEEGSDGTQQLLSSQWLPLEGDQQGGVLQVEGEPRQDDVEMQPCASNPLNNSNF